MMLWFRTRAFLRRHPSLWLPVIAAALAQCGLQALQHALIREILPRLVQGHSVLGGAGGFDPGRAPAAVSIGSVITIMFEWLEACLLVAAMLVTAVMVFHARGGRQITPDALLDPLRRLTQIAVLAFLAIIAFAIGTLITFLPAAHFAHADQQSGFLLSAWFLGVGSLISYAALGYLMTRRSLRLIGNTLGILKTERSVAAGRIAALLGAAVIAILTALQIMAGRSLERHAMHITGYWLFSNVVVELPYAALFVAFSLLVLQQRESPIATET